jgi:hypothetical protein
MQFSLLMIFFAVIVGMFMGDISGYAQLVFGFSGPVIVVMSGRRMFSGKVGFSKGDRVLATLFPFLVFGFSVNAAVAAEKLFGAYQFVFVALIPASILISMVLWPLQSWAERDAMD